MPGAVWKLNTFGDDDLGATTDTSIYAKFRIDLSVYRHCGREPSYKCLYASIQSARTPDYPFSTIYSGNRLPRA